MLRQPTFGMPHVWCFGDELRIHLVPKVAHHAMMKHGMNQGHNIFNSKIPRKEVSEKEEGVYRVQCVRHPLDRLVSTYAFFVKHDSNHNSDRGHMRAWGCHPEMTFEQFCKRYLDNYHTNIHTVPQVQFRGGQDIDLLYPIEEINRNWKKLHGLFPDLVKPSLMATHQSKRTAWEDYYTPKLRATMLELLEEDLALYEEALNA